MIKYCSIFWAHFLGAQPSVLAQKVPWIQRCVIKIDNLIFIQKNISIFLKKCLKYPYITFKNIPSFSSVLSKFHLKKQINKNKVEFPQQKETVNLNDEPSQFFYACSMRHVHVQFFYDHPISFLATDSNDWKTRTSLFINHFMPIFRFISIISNIWELSVQNGLISKSFNPTLPAMEKSYQRSLTF